MSTFESVKTVPINMADLSGVAGDVAEHFRSEGFEVTATPTSTAGYLVSIRKGDTFKAVLGTKTALNVEIGPALGGTLIRANVGVWGQQAVPTMITMLVFWPVALTQIWGMAQQANLDDEALYTAEHSLYAHAGIPMPQTVTAPQPGAYGQILATPPPAPFNAPASVSTASPGSRAPNNVATGSGTAQPQQPAPAMQARAPQAGAMAPTSSRFCTQCGAQLASDANFCSRCGKQAPAA